MSRRPVVVPVTTTDMSLALLLAPQLEAFAAAGYDVVGASAPGPFVEELRGVCARHVPLRHATRSADVAADIRAMAELRRLFRELRPDIVHTHNPKPGVYGRFAARLAGVPAIVNTQHGLYATRTDPVGRKAAVYALERAAASCSHVELVQSVEDLETLRRLGVPDRKLRLLGNGIDLQHFTPLGPEGRQAVRDALDLRPTDVVCLAVGRLVREKGYAELFRAAELVQAQVLNVVFLAVGPTETTKADGLDAAEMARAEQLGVRFLGMRRDMRDLYAASDVYVLASHREGFPRSAMEAAAMGLPIVATDIRGCRQVVEDGRTGYLVPVRSPEQLAVAIRALTTDESLRSEMGRAGRMKATTEFDQQRVIDITLETYERLLSRQARVA